MPRFLMCACVCCLCLGIHGRVANADSLRLPETPQDGVVVVKPVPGDTIVVVPQEDVMATEKQVPEPEHESKADDPVKTEERLPLQENKEAPGIVIPVAPTKAVPLEVPIEKKPEIQTRGRSIEDILADPLKNKRDAEKDVVLSIPDNADNVDFLEGKWRCETDLINLETNSPIVMEFVFDKSGKGHTRIREKDGRVFAGSATASLAGNTLNVKVGKLVTPKGGASYNGSNINCKQKGAVAVCSGKNTGTPAISWQNATFHRVK